jgi:hypothetical protein
MGRWPARWSVPRGKARSAGSFAWFFGDFREAVILNGVKDLDAAVARARGDEILRCAQIDGRGASRNTWKNISFFSIYGLFLLSLSAHE